MEQNLYVVECVLEGVKVCLGTVMCFVSLLPSCAKISLAATYNLYLFSINCVLPSGIPNTRNMLEYFFIYCFVLDVRRIFFPLTVTVSRVIVLYIDTAD